jgi:L-threonylcarbamoyladenylate synthase
MTTNTNTMQADDSAALSRAQELIACGGTLILPTETLFGLTCDASNPDALRQLFEIKHRDIAQPTAIYLPDIESIGRYSLIDHDYASRIIHEHLPGPLTVVLRSKETQWPGVVSSDGKIGIRVSTEPFVAELARLTARPLCATSANISGRPNCEDLEAIEETFAGKVNLIVYRQKQVQSAPSTVIDLSGTRPVILRQGAVDLKERLAAILREK